MFLKGAKIWYDVLFFFEDDQDAFHHLFDWGLLHNFVQRILVGLLPSAIQEFIDC